MKGGRRVPASPPPLDLTGIQIPYHFRCPISLELMRDPVIVTTGQTYDRASIESWLATGNSTCPVTRAPLSDFTLIPNHTLRRLIQQWCVAHQSDGVERIPTPKQPADTVTVKFLLTRAAAGDVAAGDRIAALHRLRSLARESEKNRSLIFSMPETRAILVEIAFGDAMEIAVSAMETLAVVPAMPAVVTRPERLAEVLVGERWSVEARIGAAGVVEGLRTAEERELVGGTAGVIEGLVELANNEKGNMMAGIRALFSLCLVKGNRRRAVEAGAGEAVVRRMGEMRYGELERGLATVELLCRGEGGRERVLGVEGVVGVLVKAMEGKWRGRAGEHGAGVLVAVVGGSEELQREVVERGVVGELLVMVQGGGCSERGRRKAQVLLKLLRRVWMGNTGEEEEEALRLHYSDGFLLQHY